MQLDKSLFQHNFYTCTPSNSKEIKNMKQNYFTLLWNRLKLHLALAMKHPHKTLVIPLLHMCKRVYFTDITHSRQYAALIQIACRRCGNSSTQGSLVEIANGSQQSSPFWCRTWNQLQWRWCRGNWRGRRWGKLN